MKSILFTWIGATDLRAIEEPDEVGIGPIAQAAKEKEWDEIVLLCDYSEAKGEQYKKWLEHLIEPAKPTVSLHYVTLSSPTDYKDIYRAAVHVIEEKQSEHPQVASTYHLSPGTPAMAAVWIILSKTKFPATLIESSKLKGVQTVSFPFDLAADYIPDQIDSRLTQLGSGLSEDSRRAFKDIVHRSEVMQRVVARAKLAALHSIPVLIEGESGTGKELFAKAIHAASHRADKPFVPINCGAIPAELIESELFGHEKGAFTGAQSQRIGHFEAADTGTLFLDEIGELPLHMQVKLLRVLQEGELKPVGATKIKKIDVRIIAATNKSLLREVAAGTFREDLLYRLAVAILQIPPLRKREGDIGLLVDTFLPRINEESRRVGLAEDKIFSASARNLLIMHAWPGNIRELINTLTRAVVWSPGKTIQEEDIREALLPVLSKKEGILDQPVSQGVDLQDILRTVTRYYLQKALEESHGNKTAAAKLLCFKSYQTLTNWLKKYGLE